MNQSISQTVYLKGHLKQYVGKDGGDRGIISPHFRNQLCMLLNLPLTSIILFELYVDLYRQPFHEPSHIRVFYNIMFLSSEDDEMCFICLISYVYKILTSSTL